MIDFTKNQQRSESFSTVDGVWPDSQSLLVVCADFFFGLLEWRHIGSPFNNAMLVLWSGLLLFHISIHFTLLWRALLMMPRRLVGGGIRRLPFLLVIDATREYLLLSRGGRRRRRRELADSSILWLLLFIIIIMIVIMKLLSLFAGCITGGSTRIPIAGTHTQQGSAFAVQTSGTLEWLSLLLLLSLAQ